MTAPVQEWRIEVVNDDASLSSLSPPVVITELVGGSGKFRVPLNSGGTFTFELDPDHPHVGEVTAGRVVRLDVWDRDGEEWVALAAWRPQRPTRTEANKGGRGGRTVKWECDPLSKELERSTVQPANGPGVEPWTGVRAFDWRCAELDTSGWGTPDDRGTLGNKTDVLPQGLAGTPRDHPNPLIQFLWPTAPVSGEDTPGTIGVFHATFTTDAAASVRPYPVATDSYVLAIDSETVMAATDPGEDATRRTEVRPLRLPAGTHTVRAMVEVFDRPERPLNVGLFALGVGVEGYATIWGSPNRRMEDWVLYTGGLGWKAALFTPETMPGLTFGHRFRLLFEERGAGELDGWSLGFTDTLDSAGVAWPSGPISHRVGDDYDTVLRAEVDAGWVEWRVRPDEKVLDAYVTAGEVTAVDLDGAVMHAEESDDHAPGRGRMLVGWRGGFVSVGTGVGTGFLSTDALTEGEAIAAGLRELSRLDPDEQQSVVLRIDPASGAQTPGVGFRAGDWVTTPLGLLRCVAVAGQVVGRRVVWTPEWSTVAEGAAERQARVLRRAVPGSLAGRSEQVAPTTDRQASIQTLGAEVLTWSVDIAEEMVLPAQTLTTEGRGHHLRVIAAEHPPVGGDMVFWLAANGQKFFGPYTLPQGPAITGDDDIDSMPQEWESTAIVAHGGPDIYFTIEITQGSGHGALTFELTCSHIP